MWDDKKTFYPVKNGIEKIKSELMTADIVLLLVSADFFGMRLYYEYRKLQNAMERHEKS